MNELQIRGTQEFMGVEIPVIEGGFGEGKRCISDKTIAEIHGMETRNIRGRLKDNINRFRDGVDYIDLKIVACETSNNSELLESLGYSSMMISKSDNIYLLSERGYSKLIKIMDTDQAWDIYDKLLDDYFSMREQVVSMLEYIELQERELELRKQNLQLLENNRDKDIRINNLEYKVDIFEDRIYTLNDEIDEMTESDFNFNLSCAIPVKLLRQDIKAFMKDFTTETVDILTRRRDLYDSYLYSRRRRDDQPSKAQFEQILVELGYSINHKHWTNLQLNGHKIR